MLSLVTSDLTEKSEIRPIGMRLEEVIIYVPELRPHGGWGMRGYIGRRNTSRFFGEKKPVRKKYRGEGSGKSNIQNGWEENEG